MRKHFKRLLENIFAPPPEVTRPPKVTVERVRQPAARSSAVCTACLKMKNVERDDVPSAFGITFSRN